MPAIVCLRVHVVSVFAPQLVVASGFGKVAWLPATFPNSYCFAKTLPVAKTPKVMISSIQEQGEELTGITIVFTVTITTKHNTATASSCLREALLVLTAHKKLGRSMGTLASPNKNSPEYP